MAGPKRNRKNQRPKDYRRIGLQYSMEASKEELIRDVQKTLGKKRFPEETNKRKKAKVNRKQDFSKYRAQWNKRNMVPPAGKHKADRQILELYKKNEGKFSTWSDFYRFATQKLQLPTMLVEVRTRKLRDSKMITGTRKGNKKQTETKKIVISPAQTKAARNHPLRGQSNSAITKKAAQLLKQGMSKKSPAIRELLNLFLVENAGRKTGTEERFWEQVNFK